MEDCSICHRPFKTLAGLRGHRQWKHPEVVGAGPAVAAPAPEDPVGHLPECELTDVDKELFRRWGIPVPSSESVDSDGLNEGLEKREASMVLTDDEKLKGAGGFVSVIAPIVSAGKDGDGGAVHHLCDDAECHYCQAVLANYASQVVAELLRRPSFADAADYEKWAQERYAEGVEVPASWMDIPGVRDSVVSYQLLQTMVRITW